MNTKISLMPDGSPVLDTDEFPMIHAGNTINYSVTAAEMKTYIGAITTIVAGGLLSGGTITAPGGTIALGAIATHTLIGNSGTASAIPEIISLGGNLTFSGSTLNATGFLTAVPPWSVSFPWLSGAASYVSGSTQDLGAVASTTTLDTIRAYGTYSANVYIGTPGGTLTAVTGMATITASSTVESVLGTATAANVLSVGQHVFVAFGTLTAAGGLSIFTK